MPTLSKLVVKLEAESAKLHTELDRANRKLSRLGRTAQKTNRTLTGAVAGMSRAVKGFVAYYAVNQLRNLATAAVDAQSEIRNLTTRLGGDQERWARLAEAAHQSDVSFQQLSTSSQRMSRSIGEAAQGTGQAGRALDQLGLSAKNLLQLNTQQQLYVVADALHKVKNQTDRVTLAVQIFGRSGTQMLQMLDGGSAGLAKLESSAASMGVEISSKTDKSMLGLEMAMKKFSTTADYTWRMIVSEFAPYITKAINWISEHMRGAVAMVIRLGKSFWALGKNVIKYTLDAVGAIKSMIVSFGSSVVSVFSTASDYIANSFRRVVDATVGVYNAAAAKMAEVIDTVSNLASAAIDYVKSVATAAADYILGYFDDVTSWISDKVNSIKNWAAEIVGDETVEGIKATVNNATRAVGAVAEKVGSAAAESIREKYTKTKDAVSTVTNAIYDGIDGSSKKVIAGISKSYSAFKEGATRIAGDIKSGVVDNLSSAYEAVYDWSDYIINGDVSDAIDKEAKSAEKLESNLKNAAKQMSEMAKGHTKVAAQTVQLKDKFDSLGKSITSALSNGIVEGKRFSNIVNGLLKSIATSLLNKTFSGIGDAIAGGVSSIFGSMFGGGKATGGAVNSGTTYLVGEKGPELFTPERSGAIIPNHALQRPAGGVNIVVNVHEGDEGGHVETQQRGGQTIIDVIVDRVKSGVAQDITSGGSSISGALERVYGVSRAAGAY